MRRLFLGAVAALTLVGCSDSPSPKETPSPTQPETSATANSETSAATPSPVADCLNGRYRLVRFVGEKRSFGTGQGGDVTVTFDDGSYLLSGAGKDPIELTVAGQTANLLVDGTISGAYLADSNKATFTVGQGTGSATLDVGFVKESISMTQVGNVLARDGEAGLACASNALILTLQDVRLEFAKV